MLIERVATWEDGSGRFSVLRVMFYKIYVLEEGASPSVMSRPSGVGCARTNRSRFRRTYCVVSGPILTTSKSFPVRRFRVFISSSFHRESGAPERNQLPPLSAKIIP